MAKRGRKPNYQKWYEKYKVKLKRKYKNYFLNWKGQYVAPHYKEKEFISDINLYLKDMIWEYLNEDEGSDYYVSKEELLSRKRVKG